MLDNLYRKTMPPMLLLFLVVLFADIAIWLLTPNVTELRIASKTVLLILDSYFFFMGVVKSNVFLSLMWLLNMFLSSLLIVSFSNPEMQFMVQFLIGLLISGSVALILTFFGVYFADN